MAATNARSAERDPRPFLGYYAIPPRELITRLYFQVDFADAFAEGASCAATQMRLAEEWATISVTFQAISSSLPGLNYEISLYREGHFPADASAELLLAGSETPSWSRVRPPHLICTAVTPSPAPSASEVSG